MDREKNMERFLLDGEDPVVLEPIDDEPPLNSSAAPAEGNSQVAVPDMDFTSVAEEPEVQPPIPTRDRIVVIGRRSAGKTIFLATLYHCLWKARDGLSMRSLSGRTHTELIKVHGMLRRGEWPQATVTHDTFKYEFELEYRGQKRILTGLDYSGEIFRQAFVEDDLSDRVARDLVSHIDRAMAVVLLVDPSVAIQNSADPSLDDNERKKRIEAQIDDDYGIVNAVQRIRDWPGGEEIPIVLVFTKADQHGQIFQGREAIRAFISQHYPALLRAVKTFKVYRASAVQTINGLPKGDSVLMNIVEPLKYCLDALNRVDERKRLEEAAAAEERAMQRAVQMQADSEHKANVRLALVIGSIITVGICVVVLFLLLH